MQRQVNKRIVTAAVFTAVAIILTYVEMICGIDSLLPVAGTKLGLANIVITVIAYLLPLGYAALVLLVKVVLTSVLFGSVTSFLFSLGGGMLAFAFVCFSKTVLNKRVSLMGVSVGASACHMIGQLLAASFVLDSLAIFNLLPLYLLVSAFTGTITGILSQILYAKLVKVKVL